MNLQETIKKELQEAMKAKDEMVLSVLRNIMSEITNENVRQKKKPNEPTLKEKKAAEGEILARLVEMYRFNDLLRAELRDKHQIDFDEETGEILNVQFGKKR